LAVATTARRRRAHTLATQPVPPAPAAQLVIQAPTAQPALAPPPPINPAPPPRPRIMAEAVPLFYGDRAVTENASDFMKAYNRNMMFLNPLATDVQKIESLSNFLGTNSPAEQWYNDLVANNIASWRDLVIAFNARWPAGRSAKQTSGEYQTELLRHKITDEDVGVIRTVGRQQKWSHVKWAEDALELATLAGIRAGPTLIYQVRKNLPKTIRKQLDNEYPDWVAFTTAVMDVGTVKLTEDREDREDRKRKEEEKERKMLLKVEAANRANTDLTAQLQCLTIGQVAVSRAVTSPVARTGNPTTMRFALQQGSRCTNIYTPPTEEQKETVRRALGAYPQQRPDDEGHKAYLAQLSAWATKYGTVTRISDQTPYPLKPGTAMICSGECFRCGTHRHESRNCPAPEGDAARLSRNETAWQALCNRTLGPFNKDNALSIRLVNLEEQGNVEGSL